MSGEIRTRPRVLVVAESMFGNTAAVAAAVARGLAVETDVELSTPVGPPREDADLIVVGAPTHAFSMPRPVTREDARRQGAVDVDVARGVREWIADVPVRPHHPRIVTFDTRVMRTRRLPGSAARAAARDLRAKGYSPLAASASFFVDDVRGPLADGELDRARAWGERLGSVLTALTASPAAGR